MVVVDLRGATFSLITLDGALSWIKIIFGAGIGRSCTLQNILAKQRSDTACSINIVMYGAAGDGFIKGLGEILCCLDGGICE